MPDSSGKIRGITVPSVPWHEASGYSLKAHCSNCGQFGTVDDHALICVRCGGKHNLTLVESAVRDADQMLWDKQTDEGPSALEKLRDKS